MISPARHLLFRVSWLLFAIAALADGTKSRAQQASGAQQANQPVEVFKPTKILAHSRLNLWLGTEDCVVHLFLDLPKRVTKTTTVPLIGDLAAGPNVQLYKMLRGGAANPPWPKERDHLYRQVKLRSGSAVCKPTGKVYDHHGVYEAVEFEITLEKLVFEDRVLRVDRPIVVFWNMPPPP
ncbi:MAG: hypothetical protein K8U03_02485 [Planctomycetia bacterium]|nr:hypothetical protein [Planctomycetia bacterium]